MKITEITERVRLQFRAEAFNVSNTYWHGQQQFNNSATSSAFGTMNKDAAAFTARTNPVTSSSRSSSSFSSTQPPAGATRRRPEPLRN